VEVLTRIGQLRAKPTKLELERMAKRLQLARNWVERYAPARYKFRPLEKLTKEIADKLSVEQKKALISLGEFLERKRTDEEVWNQIRAIAAELSMPPEELFKAAYLVLLGEERGPRLVPLIQSLGRDFVVRRFKFEK
jgi:lysyl-tRNA synthetase class 1